MNILTGYISNTMLIIYFRSWLNKEHIIEYNEPTNAHLYNKTLI
jgi:hypothetical protein